MPDQRYVFDPFEIRPGERALLLDGRSVELGSRAFDLLLMLVEHRDRVVTKDELLDRVWPGLVVEENNLHVQVFALRKVLGQQTIVTIPGRGYQFVAPVRVVDLGTETKTKADAATVPAATDATAPVHAEPNDMAVPPAPTRSRWSRLALPAGVALAVLTLAAGWFYFDSAAPNAPNTSATAEVPPLSIIVLPLANRTGEPTQDYIADGLTVSLIGDLAKLRDTVVIDATTSFTYKDKVPSAQQLGRDLRVRFVLQGDVQRDGSRLRINTQLADTTTNSQLWSATVEGEQADWFALADKMTARVGSSIGREMVNQAARVTSDRRRDPTAMDLMLRARALRHQPQSLERHRQCIELYRQVLALEPDNARAMTGLATSLILLATNFNTSLDDETARKYMQESHALATRAMEIDPRDDETYAVLSKYASSRNDREGSRLYAEKRLAMAPRSLSAHNDLAVWYFYVGQADEAIGLLRKGLELDPVNASGGIEFNLGRAHFMKGNYDEAIQWLNRAKARRSNVTIAYAYLAMAYAMKGDEALAASTAAELRGAFPDFGMRYFSRTGSPAPAFEEYWEKRLLPAARKAGLVS